MDSETDRAQTNVAITFDPKTYGAWFDSALGRRVWVDEHRALRKVLAPVAGRRALDAGCGDGRLSVALARDGASVIGVDSDPDMLLAARERLKESAGRVTLVRADVAALPFRDASFDTVTAVTVLCFAAHPSAVVREFARVVRGGGQVGLGELGRWSWWAVRRRLEGRWRGGPWSIATFWSARGVKGLLRAAGLVPRRVRGAVFYPRSATAARVFAPLDAALGAVTTLGAAFMAVAAEKPAADAVLPED